MRAVLKVMSVEGYLIYFFVGILIFANLTSKNISRVFNFPKIDKKREIREKMYLRKLVLLR